jgi:hypothetical protein
MQYDLHWSIIEEKHYKNIVTEHLPSLLNDEKWIFEEDGLLLTENLSEFDDTDLTRPSGSRRCIYKKTKSTDGVIAIKGTEVFSRSLELMIEQDLKSKLPNRPWSLFENFIYREQKAPLAMLFSEAKSETDIGLKYQSAVYDNFLRLEEAPLPILSFKCNDDTLQRYIRIIEKHYDARAKELIIPLIEHYGLGGLVYYYPYLPTRVRYNSVDEGQNDLGSRKRLAAMDNLIKIQARMLLSGYLPFAFDDHGIGQCIAPQNVTLRGGICDLGSLKQFSSIKNSGDLFTLLRSMGVMLSRSVFELICRDIDDVLYEFENPTTIIYQLSAVVHERLRETLLNYANDFELSLDPSLKSFYEHDDDALMQSLGLN